MVHGVQQGNWLARGSHLRLGDGTYALCGESPTSQMRARHSQTGERFMQRYEPKRMELATRDLVARAIFTEIENANCDFVLLDMTHKSKDFLVNRFPHIYSVLEELGISMEKDLIPVVPAAHYHCGGVLTDYKGQSSLERLYVIGEAACSGLHGANRLASNSLLESLVMGKESARDSLKYLSVRMSLLTS